MWLYDLVSVCVQRTNLGFISVIVVVLLVYLGADFLGLQEQTNGPSIFVKMIVSFVVLSLVAFSNGKYNLIVPIAMAS
jgi:hypothetical protein